MKEARHKRVCSIFAFRKFKGRQNYSRVTESRAWGLCREIDGKQQEGGLWEAEVFDILISGVLTQLCAAVKWCAVNICALESAV